MSYKFTSRSQSDPNGKNGGLGFSTYEKALAHCSTMNTLIDNYPNKPWNTDFWKSKPKRWQVYDG